MDRKSSMLATKLPYVLLVTSLIALTGCGEKTAVISSFAMGQKVQVGKVVYSVLEAEWRTDVPGGKQPPKNRVLQLTMAITNSSSQEMSIPTLRLLSLKNEEFSEYTEIEGNMSWLGLLRRLQPSLTETAAIYFDVPIGAYKLEVVDHSDAENEKTSYIEIPASLAPPPVTSGTEPSKIK